MKSIIYICEDSLNILDEGKKKIAFEFYKYLKCRYNILAFCKVGDKQNGIKRFKKKMFFAFKICYEIWHSQDKYDVIFYFPSGSVLNIRSHIISWVIKVFCSIYFKTKLVFFSFQEKAPSILRLFVFKLFHPDILVCFRNSINDINRIIGSKNIINSLPGVDNKKYFPINNIEKIELRKKYHIPNDKFVILHVGHASKKRGLEELIEFTRNNKGFYLIIILSSLYHKDNISKDDTIPANVRIICEYIHSIDEYYKLSDLYVFPAKITNSAIDYPLSIFEALACGTPVASTNFGTMKKIDSENLYFYDDINSIKKISENIISKENKASTIIDDWNSTIDNVINKIEGIISYEN